MEEKPLDSHKIAVITTRLAYDRTRAAAERTLMSWIRTSLSMVSFGFGIDTFFRSLRRSEGLPPRPISSDSVVLGLFLVGLGTVILILGAVQQYLYLHNAREEMKPIETPGPMTFSLGVAVFMIALGAVLFVLMLYRGLH